MADRIRVGVIGAGAERGWARAAHVPALQALDDYEIVAVCASSAERAARSAASLGVTLAFDDHRELIAHPAVDLVTIAVNVTHHRTMAEAALRAGKMVYAEWPLGRNVDEAAALGAMAVAGGLRTVIGLQGRHAPALRFLRDLVAAGDIGRVIGTSIRGIGSDPLWHGTLDPAFEIAADAANGNTLLAIPVGHVLDMLAFALGEFVAVDAVLAVGRPQARRTRDGAIVPVSAPDQVAVTGTLAGGALASVHYHGGEAHGPTVDWQINGTAGDLRLVAARGYANINVLEVQHARGGGAWQTRAVPDAYLIAPAGLPEAAANVHAAYAQFAADLRGGTRLAPDFAVGLRRHAVLAAIEAAALTGQRQAIPDWQPGP